MEIFKDVNGKLSSKRIIGFLIFLVVLFMVVFEQMSGKPINYQVFVTLVASGTALIGVGAFEGIQKN